MPLYATELLRATGPTGDLVEVLELAIHDHGDNELWRGRPGEEPEYRIPTRKVATKTGDSVAHADAVI